MERMTKPLLLAVAVAGAWLAVASGPALAAPSAIDANRLFREGSSLYEKGDFPSALAQFEAITDGGIENAAVYYNTGNCYYRQGEVGKAIVNYRRALMLEPRDQDARANLALLRAAAGGGDSTVVRGAAAGPMLPLRLFSARDYQVVFYVAYYVVAGCLVVALFFAGRVRRLALYGMAAAALVACLSVVVARQGFAEFHSTSEAVVIMDRAPLKSGPGDAFDETATLSDGVEVKIRTRSGIWVEIQLPGGEVGWLRETDLETV